MTERNTERDLFLELDERQAIDAWSERLLQDKASAFGEMEREIARSVAAQAKREDAGGAAIGSCHAAVDRLLRRIEHAVAQMPSPKGFFVTDAERTGAYRVAVSLLSDLEHDVSLIEQSHATLLSEGKRQGSALASLLDVGASLDALRRAAWSCGIEDGRLAEWKRTLDAADAAQVALARRMRSAHERLGTLLGSLLPDFGIQVSKNADFGERGASCNPHELRRTLSGLILALKQADEF